MSALQSFSIERVVTVLTPFFAAGAAVFTGFVGSHTGVHLNATAVMGVEIAAFLGTVGVVVKWLHGRQIPEIANLGLSSKNLDQLHAEVEKYLKAHAAATTVDEEGVVQAVLQRIAQDIAKGPPPIPAGPAPEHVGPAS